MKKIISIIPVYLLFIIFKINNFLSYLIDSMGFPMTAISLTYVNLYLAFISYTIQLWSSLNVPF